MQFRHQITSKTRNAEQGEDRRMVSISKLNLEFLLDTAEKNTKTAREYVKNRPWDFPERPVKYSDVLLAELARIEAIRQKYLK